MALQWLLVMSVTVLSSQAQEIVPSQSPNFFKSQEEENPFQRQHSQQVPHVEPYGNIIQQHAWSSDRMFGNHGENTSRGSSRIEPRSTISTSVIDLQTTLPQSHERFQTSQPMRLLTSNLPETESTPKHVYPYVRGASNSLHGSIYNKPLPSGTRHSNGFSLEPPMHDDVYSTKAQKAFATNKDVLLTDNTVGRSEFNQDDDKSETLGMIADSDVHGQVLVAVIPVPVFNEDEYRRAESVSKHLLKGQTDNPMLPYYLAWQANVNSQNIHDESNRDKYADANGVNGEEGAFIAAPVEFEGLGTNLDKDNIRFDSLSGVNSFGRFGKRQDKRRFDSISDASSFGGFGKRQDKRRFDSISDATSFGGFGKRHGNKRRFDSISDATSFGGFGKRQDDKRRFDSISDASSFGGFGKRQDDKRRFDSISDASSFGGFGKRQDNKRRFDSISDASSFGGFGKRHDNKRRFDSISDASSFGGFGKRHDNKRRFDSISDASSFGGFGKRQDDKRRFDLISDASSFGGFGKRQDDKRRFDLISDASSFGGFGKRQDDKRRFDLISDASSFGGFGKRQDDNIRFDSISGSSYFGRLGKRSVEEKKTSNSVSPISSLDGFWKIPKGGNRHTDSLPRRGSFDNSSPEKETRSDSAASSFPSSDDSLQTSKMSFDSISASSSFSALEKRQDTDIGKPDSIIRYSPVENVDKRPRYPTTFHSILGLSSLGRLNKRVTRDKEIMDSVDGVSSFGEFGIREGEDKRKFDSISQMSSFGSFRKRQNGSLPSSGSIFGYSSIRKLASEHGGLNVRSDIAALGKVVETAGNGSYQPTNAGRKNTITQRRKRALVDNVINEDAKGHNVNEHESDDDNIFYMRLHENGDMESNVNNGIISDNLRDRREENWNSMGSLDDIILVPDDEDTPQLKKRRFDRIASSSTFRILGKRHLLPYTEPGNIFKYYSATNRGVSKRRFDRISSNGHRFRSFGGKLSRPNIKHTFGKSKKRHFDRISDSSRFRSFGKRGLGPSDVIHKHTFGRPLSDVIVRQPVGWWGQFGYYDHRNRSPYDLAMVHDVSDGVISKRRFDPIDMNSPFRIFTKRQAGKGN